MREVRSWLTGQAPRPRELAEYEGRVDLRGIPLTASPTTIGDQDDPSNKPIWASLDLTGAHLEHLRFFAADIADCLFDSAGLFGLRMWGTTVTDCSFRRADLRNSAPGTGEWNGLRDTWRRVTFDRANLRGVQFSGAILDRCSFERTSKLLRIVDCEVHDCVFRGELNALLIDGRGHRYPVDPSDFSADFRDATFLDASIMGYRLDDVRLPEQPDLAVVRRYPSVLRACVSWPRQPGASEPESRLASIFERDLISHGAEDSDWCWHIGGYGDTNLSDVATRALVHVQGSIRG